MKKSGLFFLVFVACSCSFPQFQVAKQRITDPKKPIQYYVSDNNCSGHRDKEITQDRLPSSSECSDITREEKDDIDEMIQLLGGKLIGPSGYNSTVQGLQQFLTDSGVNEKFNAKEMVRPNNRQAAKFCGFSELLPPKCRWNTGVVQALMAMKLREVINNGDPLGAHSILLRNWWRPKCYNEKVSGAKASDHLQARGFDLDFSTPKQRAQAQLYLCELYKTRPSNIQVGIGCQTLHIGVGSPKRLFGFPENGARFWTYASLQHCPLKRLPEDDCWVMSKEGKKKIYSDSKENVYGAL